jgi:hypothetical protein
MASQWSDLKIQLMQTGENSGTWGNVTNANLTALEEAIAESVDVTFASADVTLTLTNSNSSQSARYLRLRCTGTTAGARSLILGSGCQIEKLYLVSNGCADAITVKNTSGSGVIVPSGRTMFVYNNATDVVDAVTHLTSLTLASALPVASGGTGSTTATFSGANITSLNATNVSSGTLAADRGGTGQTSYTDGQLLIGNSAGGLTKATLSNGSGITITNGNGSISIAATGGGGGGTVQSVGASGNVNGLTLNTNTGSAITTTGTITLGGGINVSTITTGVLSTTYGGTGSSTLSGAGIATLNGSNSWGSSNTFSSYAYFNPSNVAGANLVVGASTAPSILWNAYIKGQAGHPSLVLDGTNTSAGSAGGAVLVNSVTNYLFGFFYGTLPSSYVTVGYITSNGTGVSYGTASDYRLKENVQPLANSIGRLKQLNPINYLWKANPALGTQEGFLAHELQTVIPEAVNGQKDAVDAQGNIRPQQVDLSYVVPLLTKALQEAVSRIETLEAEVQILKGA